MTQILVDGCAWGENVLVLWVLYFKLINCHSAVISLLCISDMVSRSLRTPQERVSESLSLWEGHIPSESLLQTPLPATPPCYSLHFYIPTFSLHGKKAGSYYVEILETPRPWGRWLRISIMRNSRVYQHCRSSSLLGSKTPPKGQIPDLWDTWPALLHDFLFQNREVQA